MNILWFAIEFIELSGFWLSNNMFIANFSICLNSSSIPTDEEKPKQLQNGAASERRLDLAMDIRFKCG